MTINSCYFKAIENYLAVNFETNKISHDYKKNILFVARYKNTEGYSVHSHVYCPGKGFVRFWRWGHYEDIVVRNGTD